jgi:hypothetical protein
MKTRIVRISPVQSAKTVGLVLGGVSLPFVLFMAVVYLATSREDPLMAIGALIGAPIAYTVLGFLLTLLIVWIYNLVAVRTGGVEFEARESGN